jgi:aspartyl-tRNA(Asn)/glutamyl-tRNA(Gln) amidotransferase subunit A
VRKPAAYCGIVGYKPTYGVISRYGLFPFASSLDHIGCLTRSVKDAAIVVNSMKSHDEKDMTSIELKDDLLKNIDNNIKGKKLFFIKELCEIENYPDASDELKEILKNYHQTLENITKLGVKIEPVNIDINLLNALYPTYICLSCAEATSNDSNLTGLIFGPRGNGKTYIESMKNHRTNGFSPLIKRRFIIGSYVLQRENQEKYFLNAKRVRRLIVNKMHELFKNYDGMIMPGAAETAKKLKGATEEISLTTLALDNYMVIGNFGGFPSITIPNGFVSSMPTGINITCDIKKDAMLLNIANEIEKTMNYKNQVARRDKQ